MSRAEENGGGYDKSKKSEPTPTCIAEGSAREKSGGSGVRSIEMSKVAVYRRGSFRRSRENRHFTTLTLKLLFFRLPGIRALETVE